MDVGLVSTYSAKDKPKKKINKKYVKVNNEKKAAGLFGLDVSQKSAEKNVYKLKSLAEDR